MKTLITGATGHLGSLLVDSYIKRQKAGGLRLLIPHIRRMHFPVLHSSYAPELWGGDLEYPGTLKGIGEGVTRVIHLASPSPRDCNSRPDLALDVNVVGTLNLLKQMTSELESFTYMSTFHIYGRNAFGNITEEGTIPYPTTFYGATHYMAEKLLIADSKAKGYNAQVLRMSNSYSVPYHPETKIWELLIPKLCKDAVTINRLELGDYRDECRDFIESNDALRILTNLESFHATDTFNVGSSHTYYISEVYREVSRAYKEIYKKKLPITEQNPVTEKGRKRPPKFYFDCRKSRNLLGYEASTSLRQGIGALLLYANTMFG